MQNFLEICSLRSVAGRLWKFRNLAERHFKIALVHRTGRSRTARPTLKYGEALRALDRWLGAVTIEPNTILGLS